MKGSKPSAAFEEDELAIASVSVTRWRRGRREAVQRRRWPVAVLPVAGSAPSLDQLRVRM